MYRDLDENRIIITLERLWRRICERFPESGLSKVAEELLVVARESRAKIDQNRRPLWGIRTLAALAIVSLGAVAFVAVGASLEISPTVGGSLADLIQGGVAAVNALLLMAGAVYFLWNLEVHVKRRSALTSLHELRSIAHIVDMHQLTKDPEQVLSPGPRGDSVVAGANTNAVPVVAVPRLLLRTPVAHEQTRRTPRSIPQRSRSA